MTFLLSLVKGGDECEKNWRKERREEDIGLAVCSLSCLAILPKVFQVIKGCVGVSENVIDFCGELELGSFFIFGERRR